MIFKYATFFQASSVEEQICFPGIGVLTQSKRLSPLIYSNNRYNNIDKEYSWIRLTNGHAFFLTRAYNTHICAMQRCKSISWSSLPMTNYGPILFEPKNKMFLIDPKQSYRVSIFYSKMQCFDHVEVLSSPLYCSFAKLNRC